MYRQVRALWEVLSQQAVRVFVCAALPWAVWFSQKDFDVYCTTWLPHRTASVLPA